MLSEMMILFVMIPTTTSKAYLVDNVLCYSKLANALLRFSGFRAQETIWITS